MVKKLKSILILVLGLVFSLSCLSMCILAQKAFADNSSFYIEGAAFRIPASTEENFGIKFKAHIDSITYGSAKDNDATFGILIVPEDLKGDESQIKDISGLIPEEEKGEYVFSGAVYDILWSNVTRPFTAKAYYKVGNNYTYADEENWFDSRTLFTMATQALVDNDPKYESYTDNFNTIIKELCKSTKNSGGWDNKGEATVSTKNHILCMFHKLYFKFLYMALYELYIRR